MSPQSDASRRATAATVARKLGVARRTASTARHRLARTPRSRKLAGVTAAIATAGAISVTPSAVSGATTTASPALEQARLDSISIARIERQRASRGTIRVGLNQGSPTTKRLLQATAAKQAQARTAKLAQLQAQSRRKAAALKAQKVQELKAAKAKEAEESKSSVKLMVSGYRITATFGQAGGRWARNHTGTDFAAPIGTRIGAVMAGEVVSAEFAGAYGRRVEIRHEDGTVTWYCHMSAFSVSVGDHVAAGDEVGEVGATGNVTGPHLHFEVHPDGGDAIDPMPWLRDHGLNP